MATDNLGYIIEAGDICESDEVPESETKRRAKEDFESKVVSNVVMC